MIVLIEDIEGAGPIFLGHEGLLVRIKRCEKLAQECYCDVESA
jgi:hypothetical protein